MNGDTVIETGNDRRVSEDYQFNGDQLGLTIDYLMQNDEHLDPKLCENKPVDSFQIGQGNSHRQSLFDQDSKPTSDLQFGPLDIVVQLQHNYHATLGRDVDFNTKQRSRRVTWKDENDEDENSYYQYEEENQLDSWQLHFENQIIKVYRIKSKH
ncbi:unnamed protein product [Mytilus edulis]|uniref:Uncharacterized protein n=1 Tax=Mytilus edulis TaxID=6550 RepID=A0A8S3QCH7_MYTED|nr:unnamed protein product [Mytilus edulis]